MSRARDYGYPPPRRPGVTDEGEEYLVRLGYWPPLNEGLRHIGSWDPSERGWRVPSVFEEDLSALLADYGLALIDDVARLEADLGHLDKEVRQLRRAAVHQTADPFRELLRGLPPRLRQPTYHALARVWHPDSGGENDLMRNLNRAYADERAS